MEQQLMYPDRVGNVGAIEGCLFGCKYCKTSFQGVLKRFARHDVDASFTPHLHLIRLSKKPPRTKGKQYATIGLTGEISFASESAIYKIIEYCEKWKDRTTFMLQSKNPAFFLGYNFPTNVILATTIETNYTLIPNHVYESSMGYPYSAISKAPVTGKRHIAMLELMMRGINPLMITIEPILDFDPNTMLMWMRALNKTGTLVAINIGYDSSPETNKLPEPPLEKTQRLIEDLKSITEVRTKKIRAAWWESL